MSHYPNQLVLENMREEKEIWEYRLAQAKEQGNWAGVDLARKKINQILDAGHRIEGSTR